MAGEGDLGVCDRVVGGGVGDDAREGGAVVGD
ncbi:MAG: hypothetical protein BWY79_01975 [Actinobacteria bacterium ADurb.Bin444]|nr:MAG: hypothetical protein BWY79_01975 [Actinobacteria bacterium ADurb.Bin444]